MSARSVCRGRFVYALNIYWLGRAIRFRIVVNIRASQQLIDDFGPPGPKAVAVHSSELLGALFYYSD
jgi:hypothetical protein